MNVTILVTPVLSQYTNNRKSIKVEGTTVRDCLNSFVARYPEIEKWIFSDNNAPMTCLFLNKEVVLPENLDKIVSEGDVIDLLSVVAGG
jgi:molybdopterin converting factor small subunit